MTFREFMSAGVFDADRRRARYARINVVLVSLVAAGGVVFARALELSAMLTLVLGVAIGGAGLYAVTRTSYAFFRRGESDK